VGPWSGCSALCGNGTRSRPVSCYKKDGEGKITLLEDQVQCARQFWAKLTKTCFTLEFRTKVDSKKYADKCVSDNFGPNFWVYGSNRMWKPTYYHIDILLYMRIYLIFILKLRPKHIIKIDSRNAPRRPSPRRRSPAQRRRPAGPPTGCSRIGPPARGSAVRRWFKQNLSK
jgi:hypothetical protein